MLLSVLYNMTDISLLDTSSFGSETNSAQIWATTHNIIPDIYASGLNGFDKSLSREQAAMLIHRYAGYRGYNISQMAILTYYNDYDRIRPIARSAMSWMLATSLMSSTSDTTLSPQGSVTCGQIGDILFLLTLMR